MIDGMPLHPLIIHATVVLVPLAALGGIAISALTWARLRYGWLVVVGAFGAMLSNVAAQLSGTALYQSLGSGVNEQINAHASIGGSLLIWTILLFAGTLVQTVGQQLIDRGNSRGRIARLAGIVITVITAIVATIQVIRIGHAGSKAVWG